LPARAAVPPGAWQPKHPRPGRIEITEPRAGGAAPGAASATAHYQPELGQCTGRSQQQRWRTPHLPVPDAGTCQPLLLPPSSHPPEAGHAPRRETFHSADSGDRDAARHLLEMLTSHNDITGLQAEVDAGTEDAPRQLTATLAVKGMTCRYDARHISAFGFNSDGSVFDPPTSTRITDRFPSAEEPFRAGFSPRFPALF
jgi:hypothetical protein